MTPNATLLLSNRFKNPDEDDEVALGSSSYSTPSPVPSFDLPTLPPHRSPYLLPEFQVMGIIIYYIVFLRWIE
jgi:hypothetical protein